MWFFIAVLILWGSTTVILGQDEAILPPIIQWGWWTITLYLPALAAIEESWESVLSRILAVVAAFMLVAYFTLEIDNYITLLPTDADSPDLWPTIFVFANLLGPWFGVLYGCSKPLILRGR